MRREWRLLGNIIRRSWFNPKETDVEEFVRKNSDHRGADRVLEVAGNLDI